MCSKTSYSKSSVTQIFKQIMGVSIINYYNKLKIEEAKKLIRESQYTMAQISEMLHFSDPRYFSLMFKKITHKTPTAYRDSVYK